MNAEFRDKIRGSQIAGAAGDALRYTVEFTSPSGICAQYGQGGIREYELDRAFGTAFISDDTQMTLFTANSLLRQEGYPEKRTPECWIYAGYTDWLGTQSPSRIAPKVCWV